jgi:hypothetical protein
LKSASPERLLVSGEIDRDHSTGLEYAKREIQRTGYFRLDNLIDRVDEWKEQAEAASSFFSPETKTALIGHIHGKAMTLVQAVESIKKEYLSASPTVKRCTKVADGLNTIQLYAQRRDTSLVKSGTRDLGVIQQAEVRSPRMNRPALELLVAPYSAIALENVRSYSLDADSLLQAQAEDASSFGVGPMGLINLVRTPDISLGLGGGLGLGKDKVVSGYYVSAVASYRDLFRLGLGVGWARFSDKLSSSVKLDSKLPGSLSLDKAIESRNVRAFFVTISVKGMSVLSD